MLSSGYDQYGDAADQENISTNIMDCHRTCVDQDLCNNADHTTPDQASQLPSFDQYDDRVPLSPISDGEGDEFAGLSLTRQQIKEHNCKKGWQQWITLKGKVYDTTSFRDHFIAYNKKKAAESAEESTVSSDCVSVDNTEHPKQSDECNKLGYCGSRISDTIDDLLHRNNFSEHTIERNISAEDDSDHADDYTDDEYDEDEDCESENSSSDGEFLWKYNVLTALQKTGLPMHEIETEIRPFKIGTLQNPALPRWKYWDNIRADVLALRDDIINKDSAETGKYEREYLALLQRWLRKYRDLDPEEKHSGGDGNINVFFLTEDPDSLREWTRTTPPFDTELPDSGAWVSSELLLSPLGDTHDVFSAALRSHNSSTDPFSHDIQGKVAWAELPQDVISNDQMTPSQQRVYESRLRRGHRVYDPTLMKKRRERLADYFRKKYSYSEKKMAEFVPWAAVMEQNQRDLDSLCDGQL